MFLILVLKFSKPHPELILYHYEIIVRKKRFRIFQTVFSHYQMKVYP